MNRSQIVPETYKNFKIMNPIKTICIVLFTVMNANAIFAQSTAVDSVLTNLQIHYNKGAYDKVIALISEDMLQKVPANAIENLLISFRRDLGDLQSSTFQKKEGIVVVYSSYFEHGETTTSVAINDQNKIVGLLFKPAETNTTPNFTRNSTPFLLPFKGEWFTFWGGNTKAQNYHVINKTQQGAFDFVILDKNDKMFERSGTRNEDYFAFGKRLYAVCDAEVVEVITGVHDNPPGRMNPAQPFGNKVTLKTANNEFIVYAHLEEESIRVKKGDKVTRGQLLGNCGNSGNSSQPHLHFHLKDRAANFQAIGVTSYFQNSIVNGSLEKEYSPVKNDRIKRPD
ncbi:MAG: hypothetical protein ACI825_000225 [Planctomycetota bacterium]|jgi:hypothetical protein